MWSYKCKQVGAAFACNIADTKHVCTHCNDQRSSSHGAACPHGACMTVKSRPMSKHSRTHDALSQPLQARPTNTLPTPHHGGKDAARQHDAPQQKGSPQEQKGSPEEQKGGPQERKGALQEEKGPPQKQQVPKDHPVEGIKARAPTKSLPQKRSPAPHTLSPEGSGSSGSTVASRRASLLQRGKDMDGTDAHTSAGGMMITVCTHTWVVASRCCCVAGGRRAVARPGRAVKGGHAHVVAFDGFAMGSGGDGQFVRGLTGSAVLIGTCGTRRAWAQTLFFLLHCRKS